MRGVRVQPRASARRRRLWLEHAGRGEYLLVGYEAERFQAYTQEI